MEWWKYLWLFPLICGIAWFCTIFPLLVAWLADGRPVYPDQSNPYVAFISDIGAFRLKPLFFTGSIITALAYIGSVFSVYFIRYSERAYAAHDGWRVKATSALAVLSGSVAGLSLVFLALFDTYRHHEAHIKLLLSTFLGLGISMLCTAAIYVEKPSTCSREVKHNRPWCIACVLIAAIEVCLSIVFFACVFTGNMRVAGILEWIITFIGVGYLMSLVGFTVPPRDRAKEGEQAPLLNSTPDEQRR